MWEGGTRKVNKKGKKSVKFVYRSRRCISKRFFNSCVSIILCCLQHNDGKLEAKSASNLHLKTSNKQKVSKFEEWAEFWKFRQSWNNRKSTISVVFRVQDSRYCQAPIILYNTHVCHYYCFVLSYFDSIISVSYICSGSFFSSIFMSPLFFVAEQANINKIVLSNKINIVTKELSVQSFYPIFYVFEPRYMLYPYNT